MNLKKHLILTVGGGVALVLAAAGAFVLVKSMQRNAQTQRELSDRMTRLDQLRNRNPFPAAENVVKAQENLAAVEKTLQELIEKLGSAQQPPASIESAQFASLLDKSKRAVLDRAAANGVKISVGTGLAFDRYARGALPETQAIPRLVEQLRILETIFKVLIEARVSDITAINREVFEGGGEVVENTDDGGRRRRDDGGGEPVVAGSLPPPETNELYSVERMTVSFQARESSTWETLNAFARCSNFVVVADVEMQNTLPAMQLNTPVKLTPVTVAAPPAGMPEPPPIFPTHEERVVAGREPINVKLVLDTYRFVTPTPAPAPEAAP